MKSAHTIPHAKPPILSRSRLVRSSSARDSRDPRDWRTGMRVGHGGATVRLLLDTFFASVLVLGRRWRREVLEMKRRWGSGNGEGGRMEGNEEMAYQLSRLDTAWRCAEAWRGGVGDAGCHFRFLLLNPLVVCATRLRGFVTRVCDCEGLR
jgi:hypothetical protein